MLALECFFKIEMYLIVCIMALRLTRHDKNVFTTLDIDYGLMYLLTTDRSMVPRELGKTYEYIYEHIILIYRLFCFHLMSSLCI